MIALVAAGIAALCGADANDSLLIGIFVQVACGVSVISGS